MLSPIHGKCFSVLKMHNETVLCIFNSMQMFTLEAKIKRSLRMSAILTRTSPLIWRFVKVATNNLKLASSYPSDIKPWALETAINFVLAEDHICKDGRLRWVHSALSLRVGTCLPSDKISFLIKLRIQTKLFSVGPWAPEKARSPQESCSFFAWHRAENRPNLPPSTIFWFELQLLFTSVWGVPSEASIRLGKGSIHRSMSTSSGVSQHYDLLSRCGHSDSSLDIPCWANERS